MKRILAIGNSFSDDATARLAALCRAGGSDAEIDNLYIGGCSLERHRNNFVSGEKAYRLDFNGVSQEAPVSVNEMVERGPWDIITLQQVSGQSGRWESYLPYLDEVVAAVREKAPKAELWIHETWAYETDSDHPDFAFYDRDQEKMADCIREAYAKAAERIGAKVIPCGEVIRALRKTAPFDYANGGISLCRDGFHMNLVYGRYALACTWYECFIGDVRNNPYVPADDADPALLAMIREMAHDRVDGGRGTKL